MRTRTSFALAVAFASALSVAATDAGAAFTGEEQQSVRQVYSAAKLSTANRARSMLARPDHEGEDVRQLAISAMRSVPFDDAHRTFLHEVLLGAGSESSRSALAPALVSGLLARADDTFRAHTNDLEDFLSKNRDIGEELVRIHAFIASDIASAGHPPASGHDASMQIRDDALRAALDAYVAHIKPNSHWLRTTDATSSPSIFDLRCQVAATLSELSRGLSAKSDVADTLGLAGPLRATFERTGTIVIADGQMPDDRAKSVMRALEAAPGFAEHAELVVLGKRMPRGLSTRSAVLQVDAPVGATPVPLDGPLWPATIEAPAPDALVALAALEGSRIAARALAAAKPSIAAAMTKASDDARAKGEPSYLSLDVIGSASDEDRAEIAKLGIAGPALAASAARLVLIDVSRALDAALVRALEGRFEPLRQLLLGMTVLATPLRSASAMTTLPAGLTRGDGTIEPAQVTDVKVDASGVVSAFTFDGHAFVFTDGDHPTVTRDGAAIGLSMLRSARLPKVEGESWQGVGQTWHRLTGKPRVGLADDGRVRLVASRTGGFDAIGFDAPLEVDFSADLVVDSAAAALVVRAHQGQSSFAGVAAVLTPGSPSTLQLLSSDGGTLGDRLTDPIPIDDQSSTGWHLDVVVQKEKITATVGEKSLSIALPAGFSDAGVSLAVRGPGYVEARNVVAAKPSAKKPVTKKPRKNLSNAAELPNAAVVRPPMRVGRCEIEQDFYAILGVSLGASDEQIRRAHRRLARVTHPDLAKGAAPERRMKQVNLAASVLLDPSARARYDQLRREGAHLRPEPPPSRPASHSTSWAASQAAGAPRSSRPRAWAPRIRVPAPTLRQALAGADSPISSRLFLIALAATAMVAIAAQLSPVPAPVASAEYRIPASPQMVTIWSP